MFVCLSQELQDAKEAAEQKAQAKALAEQIQVRAMEIGAQVIMKGTKVDGIYDADPMKHPDATKYTDIPFMAILNQNLKVMDSTAIAFCRDNEIPIVVFDLLKPGNLRSILEGKPVGTLVG